MPTSASARLRMLAVEDLRETNESRLLHVIRERQPISRADLVKETGLRAGTVSVIVSRLLRAGVVLEGESAPSGGGRPATYVEVNAEKAYAVGVSIGVRETIYGVCDFNGKLLNRHSLPTRADAAEFLAELGKQIAACLKTSFSGKAIAGVGVSIPGLVDRVSGRLIRSPNLGWQDVPITAILQKKLKVPVWLENDANAAALSELWYGAMDIWGAHRMLFVLIVEGIGTGLIINREVYVGSRVGLGGFGHIPMDPAGPKCSCGSVGCWEAVASDRATLARFISSGESAADGVSSVTELISLARAGNQAARRELETTGVYIGRAIKALSHGLAPEVIVIGGQIAEAWPMLEPVLMTQLQGEYLVEGISTPTLKPASVKDSPFFGAFSLALRAALQKRSASANHA